MTESVSKRLAKNTLFLYGRLMFLMLISFYTSRVVLNALGVVDYGVCNVVGGILSLFAFVNSSMTLASNRFLSYALGTKDDAELRATFHTSFQLHALIAIAVVILAETVGIWYFNHYLNIPEARRGVAMLIYQFSIIGCALSVVSVPYSSTIIAYEDMGVLAALSMTDGVLKLAMAFLLGIVSSDKLTAWAVMLMGITLLSFVIRIWVCRTRYRICRISFTLHRRIFRRMSTFIWLEALGSFAYMLRGEGVNLALNYFFGVSLNAARNIAMQVNAGVLSLMCSFLSSINPQVVKSYAANDYVRMHSLVRRASKFSFLAVYVIALPVFTEAEPILTLWLKILPDHAVVFVKLIIIASLFEYLSEPLQTAIHTSGRMKYYQPTLSALYLLEVAVVLLAFKSGFPPGYMYLVQCFFSVLIFIMRLMFAKALVKLSAAEYLKGVTLREAIVVAVTFPTAMLLRHSAGESLAGMLFVVILSFLVALSASYLLGMDKTERTWVKAAVIGKLAPLRK